MTPMSDHADMRRRAAQHASYGNYWAGKCVGLLDEIARLQEVERLKTANGRALVADDSDEIDSPPETAPDDKPVDLMAALEAAVDAARARRKEGDR